MVHCKNQADAVSGVKNNTIGRECKGGRSTLAGDPLSVGIDNPAKKDNTIDMTRIDAQEVP
jgi:hypothetical protein